MSIRVCVAGATGWTGSLLTKTILHSSEFELTGAIARRSAGQDIGDVLGLPAVGIRIASSLDEAQSHPADVLVDFTKPDSVKARTLQALDSGLRVVIGTSGFTAQDFQELSKNQLARTWGVRGRQFFHYGSTCQTLRPVRRAACAVLGDCGLCSCR